ncbi:MAG: hypothetical protein C0484_03235 [Rhodospirillum sp.]|nr:hypothetical protein [Rhodospirillum sp.]
MTDLTIMSQGSKLAAWFNDRVFMGSGPIPLEDRVMTTLTMADVSYWLFTIFNVLRIASYLPQIYRVATDPYGASAIAYSTWGLWAVANASTALYAAYNVSDLPLAAINLLNALCCFLVILLTIYKRRAFRLNQPSTSVATTSRAMESGDSNVTAFTDR